jgi:hypothetical protein
MAVVWSVTMATKIRPEMLARVSAYDGLGSMMGMPAGALVAGPIAAVIGISATQYGAAAITVLASLLVLISRDVRTLRAGPADRLSPAGPVDPAGPASLADPTGLADPAPDPDEAPRAERQARSAPAFH